MFNQDLSITELKGVGPKTATPFFNKGIETINQLMTFLPISYITYSSSNLIDGENLQLSGVINSPISSFQPRRNLLITNFTITDGKQNYKIVAWNMRHLKFAFKTGDKVSILGKYDQKKDQITLKKIGISDEENNSEDAFITPAYSKITGVSNIKVNKLILQAIDQSSIDQANKHILKELHNPSSVNTLTEAKEAFKRIEFTNYYLKIKAQSKISKNSKHYAINIDMNIINQFIASLPFALTLEQDSAVKSGLEALQATSPMQSLILGDVGCGKTIVSIILALATLEDGGQVAFMLPTEILAKQVYEQVQKYLNYSSDLLVSSVTPSHKKLLKARLETGAIKVVVGTQALLEDDVVFKNLKFVIIDEQHRFGVNQRSTLINKGEFVNYCYLSATPIPRTLAHTLYGVMDVISIKSKPANRIPIQTNVFTINQKKNLISKINEELENGNQVFIVTPLAYEVEDLNLSNSLTTFEKFQKFYKDKYRVGMINGQLKAKHKDKIMDMFRHREYDILVATTVIEVGVDIPGATVMVVLNAERFGLATLHQLRGRVGRNNLQSYCLLLDQSNNPKSKERLELMENINDGEKLAKLDYEMRGMGEITGLRQSGNEDFKLFNLQNDYKLAEEIIAELS